MSFFNGMGEEGKRENLKGRRPKEREGEAEEAKGSQQNTEEGGKMQTQKRDESLAPSPQHQPMALNTGVHASVLT